MDSVKDGFGVLRKGTVVRGWAVKARSVKARRSKARYGMAVEAVQGEFCYGKVRLVWARQSRQGTTKGRKGKETK